jgi:Spherulation-specific family 4
VILGVSVSAASAAPLLVTSVSVEQLSLPNGASTVRDRSADGGRAVQFTRNSVATGSLALTSPVTSLTLNARGTQCSKSWPQLQLSIDGAVVLSAVAATTGWAGYTVSGLNLAAGAHAVSLAASNIQSGRCTRTLFADVLSAYGQVSVPPPPPPPAPPTPPVPISGPTAVCQKVVIPSYAYPLPTTFWDGGISAANPVQFMIADPANGPGKTKDANYVAVIARAEAARIRVMGYVDTDYGNRSAKSVQADIAAWKTLYGVTDIFFDETASSANLLPYYQGIADAVHATAGAITMFNPGTNVDEGYMQMADILNIFEGSGSEYADFTPASWVSDYPSSRFSNLIYAVPDAASMTAVLGQSIARAAGSVYITSDKLPNPWDVLPPYWTAETALISQACAAATAAT